MDVVQLPQAEQDEGRQLESVPALRALCSNRNITRDKAARELDHRPRPITESIRDAYASFASAGSLPLSAVSER